MLLVIDIGNTSTSFGVFVGERLIKTWRCETKKVGRSEGRKVGRSEIEKIIISSVVPEMDKRCSTIVQRLFNKKPIFITHKNAGIKIGYPHPKEIGADRLVNAVAAWKKYRASCIVVDFGTATTLDYIDGKGVYCGGAIAPGIGISNEALARAAAKLPRVKIKATKRMLPRTTKEAMQCGIYQGYIGMIEHLIKRTIKEVGGRPKVIATGGFAPLIAKGTKIFDEIDVILTLNGLQLIGSRLR